MTYSLWLGDDTNKLVGVLDARLGMGGLLATNSADPYDVRPGVLFSGNQSLLSSRADLKVDVADFHAVVVKDRTNGPYIYPSLGTVTVTVPAPPALGSKRTDLLWVEQHDKNAVIDGDADFLPTFGVVTGDAVSTGTPAKPSVPAGATEVGTITWDSTSVVAAATNAAQCTVATTCQWTVTRGNAIPVRNTTERAALTAYTGLQVKRLDASGRIETYTGSAWDFVDWTSMSIVPGGWSAPTEPTGHRWQATYRDGRVSFRGTIANNSFTGGWTTICMLPAGVPAPTDTVALSIAGNTTVVRYAQVLPTGEVQVQASLGSGAWFILGGGYPVG